ncbi:MAG: 3-phosphoshikimate 1-carboxyvinyltransferase [Lachnospiraceae bacterium]|nr:3-phosphoshikimate 1-carboxyvinyltransferase [Lachnospiraceae bacterium]
MKVTITPGKVEGIVKANASKSYAHRYLMASALSDKSVYISNITISEDVQTTIDAIKALGARVDMNENGLVVHPLNKESLFGHTVQIHCNESGTTLRLLLPIVAALTDDAIFYAKGRLPLRPLADLKEALQGHGKEFFLEFVKEDLLNEDNLGEAEGFEEEVTLFRMKGRLTGGEYKLPGNVSSQYVSGLLMALPLLKEDSIIKVTTDLQSTSYVEMTRQVLFRYEIDTQVIFDTHIGYAIDGGMAYRSPGELVVNGDWSNAANFIVLNELIPDHSIKVLNLSPDFLQSDSEVIKLLHQITRPRMHNTIIDVKNNPDLLPPLAVAAAFGEGTTTFIGGKRLRYKESDRLNSTVEMINSLGGVAEETEEGIVINGSGILGGTVRSFKDHRIVMAASIAGIVATHPVTILEAEAVNKSYPEFFEVLRSIGADVSIEE